MSAAATTEVVVVCKSNFVCVSADLSHLFIRPVLLPPVPLLCLYVFHVLLPSNKLLQGSMIKDDQSQIHDDIIGQKPDHPVQLKQRH
jgi:hypothetical protein